MVSVLIVEDDANKQSRIERVIKNLNRNDVVLACKRTAHEALVWLQANPCDVLILDLQIPTNVDSARPSDRGGIDFLRKIQRADSRCNLPNHCIGLTAFSELQAAFAAEFANESWVIAKYDQSSSDWEHTIANAVSREVNIDRRGVREGILLPLHGIRTSAEWHRTLADVAQAENWICPIHRWWYGRFSIFQFLSPWARAAKVLWFQQRHSEIVTEFGRGDRVKGLPSVVAHSFGTLILGNALLKFRHIRVGKVILCGSILPREFPWDQLIENGQVGSVLNEIGRDDIWPIVASYVIPGTGASGSRGFTRPHPLLAQQEHNLKHVEFFDAHRMTVVWFKYLRELTPVGGASNDAFVAPARGDHPLIAALVSPIVFAAFVVTAFALLYVAAKSFVVGADVMVAWIWKWKWFSWMTWPYAK